MSSCKGLIKNGDKNGDGSVFFHHIFEEDKPDKKYNRPHFLHKNERQHISGN